MALNIKLVLRYLAEDFIQPRFACNIDYILLGSDGNEKKTRCEILDLENSYVGARHRINK